MVTDQTDTQRMPTLEDTAIELAKWHRKADPATIAIKYFPGGESIRLLEVSESAPTTDEILPFRFATDPTSGIMYPSIVILVSPDEWRHIKDGNLNLPSGWDLEAARDI